MCQLNKVPLQKNYPLFRYDLKEPPADWDETYHSVEYTYDTQIQHSKVKNVVGAYFFYGNREVAQKTGCFAANKCGLTKIWITETSVQEIVNLLDFTAIDNIPEIIYGLDRIGINILTDDFYRYKSFDNIISLSSIKDKFEEWKGLAIKEDISKEEYSRQEALFNEISDLWINHIGLFCQSLTDFDNGVNFKQILQDKGLDGYMFRDSLSSLAESSICIFDNRYLGEPLHTERNVQELLFS